MTRHINSKLGVNAYVKIVSAPEAPVLKLILDITSPNASLDLRMPGLWPRGTCLIKYRPAPTNSNSSAHGSRSQGRAGNQYQHGQYGQQNSYSGRRYPSPHNRDIGNVYVNRNRDQQQLN